MKSFSNASWKRLGSVLEPSWSRLGAVLGPSWGPLGALLGPLGAILGHLGALLGPLGSFLGPSWGHLGCLKTDIGEKLKNATPPTRNAHFRGQDEAKMGPSWAKLGSSCDLGPSECPLEAYQDVFVSSSRDLVVFISS